MASQLFLAKEAFMVGTTIDALPIIEVEGKTIGNGKPGPVSMAARNLIQKDQIQNGLSLT